jgi:glycosyltransferase involved in cell wall biosynthesis
MMAAYYGASDVVVLPSYHESFGLTALEGMMMGAPTIVSDVEGPRQLFVDPLLAYGVRPGSIEDITERVDFVLSNQGEARKNAEAVRRAVIDRYSIDRMVDNTMDLYQQERSNLSGGGR